MICFLWDIVKALEPGADERAGRGRDKESLCMPGKQPRQRIRMEMHRHFVRKRRRGVKLVYGSVAFILYVFCLFGLLVEIDKVFGNSVCPYLNYGDWTVYGRMGRELQKDDVVAFEKDGENPVKRTVGLPGDTAEINKSGDHVIINGILISEDYVTLPDTEEEESQIGPPLTVMGRQYLVLRDSWEVSIDGRDSGMGTVPAESILEKVVLIICGRGQEEIWRQIKRGGKWDEPLYITYEDKVEEAIPVSGGRERVRVFGGDSGPQDTQHWNRGS